MPYQFVLRLFVGFKVVDSERGPMMTSRHAIHHSLL